MISPDVLDSPETLKVPAYPRRLSKAIWAPLWLSIVSCLCIARLPAVMTAKRPTLHMGEYSEVQTSRHYVLWVQLQALSHCWYQAALLGCSPNSLTLRLCTFPFIHGHQDCHCQKKYYPFIRLNKSFWYILLTEYHTIPQKHSLKSGDNLGREISVLNYDTALIQKVQKYPEHSQSVWPPV